MKRGPANVARLRALGQAESDHDGLARKKRGNIYRLSALSYEWSGTASPPDLLPVGPTAEILSRRVLAKLVSAGIRGLGDLPAYVRLPDGSSADYALLIVTHEVSSICFGRSERPPGRPAILGEPRIQGLDSGVADAFVLPYESGLHNVIVSSRFVEIASYCGISNAVFTPVEELSVAIPDPDQLLC